MGLDETIFFKSASLFLLDNAHVCFLDCTLQESIDFLMCSSIAGFYTDFIQWKLVTGWNCNIWACYIEPQQRPLPWIWLVIAINTTSLNLFEAHIWRGGTTRNKLVQQKSRFSGQIETPEYLTSPLTPLSHPFIPKGLFKVLVGICKFTSESILSPPLIWMTTAGQGWLKRTRSSYLNTFFSSQKSYLNKRHFEKNCIWYLHTK